MAVISSTLSNLYIFTQMSVDVLMERKVYSMRCWEYIMLKTSCFAFTLLHPICNYLNSKLTSASWDLAISTSVFAAGWTMSRSFIIVAPSFEIVDFPWLSTISLSIPRGPRVVRTASTTAWQALMFDTSWGLPWEFSVPSFNRMICGC